MASRGQGKLSFWHKSFTPLQSHSHGSALKALSISADNPQQNSGCKGALGLPLNYIHHV